MNLSRILAITRKEIFHIRRDPFTLALALVMPVIMVSIFGSSIEFNIRDMNLAIHDRDHSQASRLLIQSFTSSDYFHPHTAANPLEAQKTLDSGLARAALFIEPEFEKKFYSGRPSPIQIIVDGADNTTVGSILGYMGGIQNIALKKLSGVSPRPVLRQEIRYLYNPELSSRWFVIPGLTVVVTAILSILLTALTVSREWENGSMELLLSTPVTAGEIIIGKLLPYSILGFGAMGFVYLTSRIIFQVPFRGSHLLFSAGFFLFLIAYLAQGLLISVLVRKQQIAMQISIISGFLPSMLLSGFIFPVENMPLFFQYFTAIFPARWFMSISRNIYLKGASATDLAQEFLVLLGLVFILVLLAVKKFKKDLEP